MENMENEVVQENVEATQQSETVVVEETPVAAPEAVEAPVEETPAAPAKKRVSVKKIVIIAAILAVVAIAAVFLYNILTNTYEKPVAIMEETANTRKITNYANFATKQLNGFAEDEVCAVFNIMMKSEDVQDYFDNIAEKFNDSVEDKEDAYGSNYKYTYEIDEKEELEREDLRDLRDAIKEMAEGIDELCEEVEDYDSEDWEKMGDELGLTKSQCKDLIKAFEDLQKALKSPKVEEGYKLTVTVTLTGSELDEPEEDEMTVNVYKVNGRWVSETALSIISFLRYIG